MSSGRDDWRTLRTSDRRSEPRVSRNVEDDFAERADEERRQKLDAEQRERDELLSRALADAHQALGRVRDALGEVNRRDYRDLDNIRRGLVNIKRRAATM